MPKATILKGIGSFYYVKSGDDIIECKARGIFRKDNTIPLPGDRVEISVLDEQKKIGRIEEIFPRISELIRPAVANVGTVIIVIAVKSPAPNFELIDKILISAAKQALKCVLCVNKIDIDDGDCLECIKDNYGPAQYPIIATSSVLNQGFEELLTVIKGDTSVLAGASGVGKSTILNKIRGFELMQTGGLSRKIDRGKHTTRHAELFELCKDTFIVDTPGFSSYEMPKIDCKELQLYYPEFDEYIGKCMFRGCSHVTEPSCAVRDALQLGKINEDRYLRYSEFFKRLEKFKEW